MKLRLHSSTTMVLRQNLISLPFGPGDEYAPHSHSYNKVIYGAAGSILWEMPATGEKIEMHPGDRLELLHGVVHSARVGPQGVTCLEAHL